ncbi:MAG: tRNA (adenosine(37)-N6)-threonylcarbamoyltransferase complex ATPase subunit type 1 TsaE [Alistipes sp.]|nr:tRNA (adenosine(37)-N6)-threonylcarbamoyltransferase complex ATPase subunit type 1 TsaE [Alistipes sp.]
MKQLHISSQDELPEVAQAILDSLDGRTVVAFFGRMGAGKTTLIREIVTLAGSDDTVTSPTFAIVNQYSAKEGRRIFHFDFYRLDRPEEVFDIGYEEYFYSGDLCLVEWPEKVEGLLPENTLAVTIETEDDDDSARLFTIE